jgi:DNA polymerase-3 subunit epsilon
MSLSMTKTKVLFFDTETTGLPPRLEPTADTLPQWDGCRMVQIAWEVWSSNQKSECHSYLIQPDGFEIPEEAQRIHGISTAEALEKGLPLKRVLELFLRSMKGVRRMVAHNISFDVSILKSELLRAGLAVKLPSLYCTMKMGTPKGKKWMRLGEMYLSSFGRSAEETYGELHRADVDVRCCADLYWKQVGAT